MNRVRTGKGLAGLEPICGRCKKASSVERKPVNVTDAIFPAEVELLPLPVLLDLCAAW
jgi:hypothetical protein